MWDPKQYELFRNERSRPFFDLLEGLVNHEAHALEGRKGVRHKNPSRVVDLGCGTGELTKILHEKTCATQTIGIDSSEEMLSKAPTDVAGLSFERADIAQFVRKRDATTPAAGAYRSQRGDDRYDLIFSNAALQWVPSHQALFADLVDALAPGGELAVQMPVNHDHVSHLVAAEVAKLPRFEDAFGGYVRHVPVLAPETYATLLEKLGMIEQNVRVQVYAHRLESRAGVIDWVKGTLLTDYAVRLSEADYTAFLAEYTRLLFEQLPDERPFFYPFKRILIWALKSP